MRPAASRLRHQGAEPVAGRTRGTPPRPRTWASTRCAVGVAPARPARTPWRTPRRPAPRYDPRQPW
eukprot:7598647-Lingulodinium_polyedra.AAC.1